MERETLEQKIPEDLRELYESVQRTVAGTTQTSLECEVQRLIERIARCEGSLVEIIRRDSASMAEAQACMTAQAKRIAELEASQNQTAGP